MECTCTTSTPPPLQMNNHARGPYGSKPASPWYSGSPSAWGHAGAGTVAGDAQARRHRHGGAAAHGSPPHTTNARVLLTHTGVQSHLSPSHIWESRARINLHLCTQCRREVNAVPKFPLMLRPSKFAIKQSSRPRPPSPPWQLDPERREPFSALCNIVVYTSICWCSGPWDAFTQTSARGKRWMVL